jgi:hypothetical protein
MPPILYLDYDGCLHAEDVRLMKRRPVIFENNMVSPRALFEHVPLLEQLLAPHPELRIVLSTSWVRHMGYSYSLKQLTPGLQARVIGATWHSHMQHENTGAECFDQLTRFQAIRADAARRKILWWLALDDNLDGWPEASRHRVVAPTDPILALGQPGKADELAAALGQLCSPRETMRVTFRSIPRS